MWWPVVFWLLLVPLIVIEFILFLKTRRFSWLIYALAIFTYVIAITYTIDVFDLGKNAVILILLASSGLMVLLGRRLRKDAPAPSRARTITAIVLGSLMILLFIVSAVFGQLEERIATPESIDAEDIAYHYQETAKEPIPISRVMVLNQTLTNRFFLPVPVDQGQFRICLQTTTNEYDLYQDRPVWREYQEVAPGTSESIPLEVNSIGISRDEDPTAVLIYRLSEAEQRSYAPCADMRGREPQYRIPVE